MEKLYSNIFENIKRIQAEINEAVEKYGRDKNDVRLMAVTKTVLPELVNEAISSGIDLLGENKAQEFLSKYESYNKNGVDIHFIGHLQSNKVRMIIDKVSMIQSVDRISLAKEIDSQAKNIGKKIDVLIEVNIGMEDSKSGVKPENLENLLTGISQMPHIVVKGLMAIPPFCPNIKQSEKYFFGMRELFVDMKGKNIDNVSMDVLSMGMSGDFKEAIKHGANIIRIGTAMFGQRNYS